MFGPIFSRLFAAVRAFGKRGGAGSPRHRPRMPTLERLEEKLMPSAVSVSGHWDGRDGAYDAGVELRRDWTDAAATVAYRLTNSGPTETRTATFAAGQSVLDILVAAGAAHSAPADHTADVALLDPTRDAAAYAALDLAEVFGVRVGESAARVTLADPPAVVRALVTLENDAAGYVQVRRDDATGPLSVSYTVTGMYGSTSTYTAQFADGQSVAPAAYMGQGNTVRLLDSPTGAYGVGAQSQATWQFVSVLSAYYGREGQSQSGLLLYRDDVSAPLAVGYSVVAPDGTRSQRSASFAAGGHFALLEGGSAAAGTYGFDLDARDFPLTTQYAVVLPAGAPSSVDVAAAWFAGDGVGLLLHRTAAGGAQTVGFHVTLSPSNGYGDQGDGDTVAEYDGTATFAPGSAFAVVQVGTTQLGGAAPLDRALIADIRVAGGATARAANTNYDGGWVSVASGGVALDIGRQGTGDFFTPSGAQLAAELAALLPNDRAVTPSPAAPPAPTVDPSESASTPVVTVESPSDGAEDESDAFVVLRRDQVGAALNVDYTLSEGGAVVQGTATFAAGQSELTLAVPSSAESAKYLGLTVVQAPPDGGTASAEEIASGAWRVTVSLVEPADGAYAVGSSSADVRITRSSAQSAWLEHEVARDTRKIDKLQSQVDALQADEDQLDAEIVQDATDNAVADAADAAQAVADAQAVSNAGTSDDAPEATAYSTDRAAWKQYLADLATVAASRPDTTTLTGRYEREMLAQAGDYIDGLSDDDWSALVADLGAMTDLGGDPVAYLENLSGAPAFWAAFDARHGEQVSDYGVLADWFAGLSESGDGVAADDRGAWGRSEWLKSYRALDAAGDGAGLEQWAGDLLATGQLTLALVQDGPATPTPTDNRPRDEDALRKAIDDLKRGPPPRARPQADADKAADAPPDPLAVNLRADEELLRVLRRLARTEPQTVADFGKYWAGASADERDALLAELRSAIGSDSRSSDPAATAEATVRRGAALHADDVQREKQYAQDRAAWDGQVAAIHAQTRADHAADLADKRAMIETAKRNVILAKAAEGYALDADKRAKDIVKNSSIWGWAWGDTDERLIRALNDKEKFEGDVKRLTKLGEIEIAADGRAIPKSEAARKLFARVDDYKACEGLSDVDRLLVLLKLTVQKLPESLQKRYSAMFDELTKTENIALLGGAVALWATSHYYGAGFVVDAALFAVMRVLLGQAIYQISGNLYKGMSLGLTAETSAEMDTASAYMAQGFADAVAMIGERLAINRVGKAIKGEKKAATEAEKLAERARAAEEKAAANAGTPANPADVGKRLKALEKEGRPNLPSDRLKPGDGGTPPPPPQGNMPRPAAGPNVSGTPDPTKVGAAVARVKAGGGQNVRPNQVAVNTPPTVPKTTPAPSPPVVAPSPPPPVQAPSPLPKSQPTPAPAPPVGPAAQPTPPPTGTPIPVATPPEADPEAPAPPAAPAPVTDPAPAPAKPRYEKVEEEPGSGVWTVKDTQNPGTYLMPPGAKSILMSGSEADALIKGLNSGTIAPVDSKNPAGERPQVPVITDDGHRSDQPALFPESEAERIAAVEKQKQRQTELDDNPYLAGKTPEPGERSTGVSRAAQLEVDLVRRTGQGTIKGGWTPAEVEYIRQTGRLPKGVEGHHINSVDKFPEWAGDPRNIDFVRGRAEHLARHNGNYQKPTTGPLIDRGN